MRDPAASSDSDVPLSPLTVACQGFALLALEGTSLGLGLAELALWPRLPAYAARNEIAHAARLGLLLAMALGAGAFCALGVLRLRPDPASGAHAVRDLSRRLAPVALAGLAPLLFAKWLWIGRDLAFLALAAVWALGGQAALRVSLTARAATAGSADAALPAARLSRRGWTALVGLGALGYAAFFAAVTLTNHWALRTTSFDLGIFDNLMWNLVHGGPFLKAAPALGPTGSHFGRHATLGAYAFAPLYALAPRPETLLVLQAGLIGAGAIPLYLFARRRLGDAAAAVMAGAYLLYPPVHGANLYDFHFLSTAPVFIWTTLHLLDTGRDRLGALAAALTLTLREDVAAGLVVVGAYLCLSGRRPRAGLVLAAAAAAYTAVVKLGLMPLAGGDHDLFLMMYRALVPAGRDSFAGVLETVLGNPAYAVSVLLERDKLVYVLLLLTPLAFLPLRRPLGLLFVAPGALFTLLATGYAPLVQISFQYTAHWTAFVFIAAVVNLAAVARPGVAGDSHADLRRRAWLGAVIAATLVCSHQFGAVLQQDTARGGFARARFGATAVDREHYRAIRDLVAQVPPRARIAATERLVPQVSSRPDAYTLRVGVFDAEYALFPVDPALMSPTAERPRVVALLQNGEFGVVEIRGPFALARRGYVADNSAALERLSAR